MLLGNPTLSLMNNEFGRVKSTFQKICYKLCIKMEMFGYTYYCVSGDVTSLFRRGFRGGGGAFHSLTLNFLNRKSSFVDPHSFFTQQDTGGCTIVDPDLQD